MAQFRHRLGLDLADPLPGDSVDLAYLVQRLGLSVGQTEPHFHDAGLSFTQGFQHALQLLLQQRETHRVGGHEVNETWFTDVKVPVANLVGKENEGWTYAKYLLAHERTGIAGVARSKKGIERLREIASVELDQGQPIIRNPDFAKKISELEIDLSALEYTELRTLALGLGFVLLAIVLALNVVAHLTREAVQSHHG